MKLFYIKHAIVFSFMAIGFAANAIAQVYSDEWCLFQWNGKDAYWAIKFEGNYAYVGTGDPKTNYGPKNTFFCFMERHIRTGFNKSSNFLEELPKNEQYTVYIFTYDPELSTPSRSVYKKNTYSNCTAYVAVDKNITTIKRWSIKKGSEQIWSSCTCSGRPNVYDEFVRVDPEIFKPKAVNYDFLND